MLEAKMLLNLMNKWREYNGHGVGNLTVKYFFQITIYKRQRIKNSCNKRRTGKSTLKIYFLF